MSTGQGSLLVVAQAPSNHLNDKQEAVPTWNVLTLKVSKPKAAALDNDYFSEGTIRTCEQRGIDPYIATGHEPHLSPNCQTNLYPMPV